MAKHYTLTKRTDHLHSTGAVDFPAWQDETQRRIDAYAEKTRINPKPGRDLSRVLMVYDPVKGLARPF